MTTEQLRAAAARVLAQPTLCRCGKDGCRFAAAVAVARAYLDGLDTAVAAGSRAVKTFDEWFREHWGHHSNPRYEVVARAAAEWGTAAERERCARVVETFGLTRDGELVRPGLGVWRDVNGASRYIPDEDALAAAIRTG
jgi:hypothetical protein